MYRMVLVDGIKEFMMFLTVEHMQWIVTTGFNAKAFENMPGLKGTIMRLLPT